jgi:hydroxypyruvate isomerase
MLKFAANFSMMFQEVTMLDRFAAASAVGFTGAEIQNPYAESTVDLAQAYQAHHLDAVLFNTPEAIGALPGREAAFESGITQALEYCRATSCSQVHCLAGTTDHPHAEATFVANLKRAAPEAAHAGVKLLLEPLNSRDNPGYFLTHSVQARRIIDLVGADNVRLQYDLYHMQIMEGYLTETIKANLDIISHVQIAGVPGRNEPDNQQEVNFPHLFSILEEAEYNGWIACEYRPRNDTVAGLAWAKPYGISAQR